MITITGCGPLFDSFVAAGLNNKQVMQELGAIVQNEGLQLSERDIDDWAVEATQKLIKDHREQLMLINATVVAIRGMGKTPPLGYTKNGTPIYPINPGMIATAAVISCTDCHTVIRGMGGPQHGAKCVPCYEKGQANASSDPSSSERA